MWWYDVDKHSAKKYEETLPQNVINIIVKYYKRFKDESL